MKEIPKRIEELKENFERSDKNFICKLMIEKILQLDPYCRLITDEVEIGLKSEYKPFLKTLNFDNVLKCFCAYWYYTNDKDFEKMLEIIEENILS